MRMCCQLLPLGPQDRVNLLIPDHSHIRLEAEKVSAKQSHHLKMTTSHAERREYLSPRGWHGWPLSPTSGHCTPWTETITVSLSKSGVRESLCHTRQWVLFCPFHKVETWGFER